MKKFLAMFMLRGLVAASGGPVILGIVYGIIGAAGNVTALTPKEACLGILTVTVMAFIAAGITAIYQTERLPLMSAILIHAAVLYLDYLIMYLINSWIPRNLASIGIFTASFTVGFALVWLIIFFVEKRKADRINIRLKNISQ